LAHFSNDYGCRRHTDPTTVQAGNNMEPTIGIEPMNLFLTKEALYRLSYVGIFSFSECLCSKAMRAPEQSMERETRLELATFSLEG
jgi:hypothetical protein